MPISPAEWSRSSLKVHKHGLVIRAFIARLPTWYHDSGLATLRTWFWLANMYVPWSLKTGTGMHITKMQFAGQDLQDKGSKFEK